ncbi:Zinc finger A20 and AN1 domain-containing stress-associated protein [Zostera marina]|uniref:Zinc finger A20 and AN1 domain-containing stress-associated protein n=1 Tax=Zostera marina TaxID=29655 RepID=A0A0K9PVW6_ZOSMR|nr:Zinc finger A20 and AN1 domain-containing stress-associated protein [Zostera marina]
MAEEQHRCQATQEGHRLCANNCGCLGSPATLNLCSKCYRDFRLKESLLSPPSSSSSSSLCPAVPLPKEFSSPVATTVVPASISTAAAVETSSQLEDESAVITPQQQPSRCTVCRKRVGLTAFRCRCGNSFCGTHRYPEVHNCGFDFKSVGKQAIARANPVVKAQKLRKI